MVHENSIRANQGKCHFLASFDIIAKFSLHTCIPQRLPGATLSRKFYFKEHVTNLCGKGSGKTQSVASIFAYVP